MLQLEKKTIEKNKEILVKIFLGWKFIRSTNKIDSFSWNEISNTGK